MFTQRKGPYFEESDVESVSQVDVTSSSNILSSSLASKLDALTIDEESEESVIIMDKFAESECISSNPGASFVSPKKINENEEFSITHVTATSIATTATNSQDFFSIVTTSESDFTSKVNGASGFQKDEFKPVYVTAKG